MHKRGCNAADEHLIGLPVHDPKGVVDRLSDLGVLEREQRCDVDAVPGGPEDAVVLTLHEADVVALAMRSMILSDLHQTERRVLVLVAGLDEEDVVTGHRTPYGCRRATE